MSDNEPNERLQPGAETSAFLDGLDLKTLMSHGLESGESRSQFPEIPGYTLLSELGRGGMGAVFLAEQNSLGRCVAVKILSVSGGPEDLLRERLGREARTMAKLSHPNLVAVYDFLSLEDGNAAIVMERIVGSDVRKSLLKNREEPVPIDLILKIGAQAAAALEAAHASGVVHRDIKPENLLLDEKGDIRVTDFGLALASCSGDERLTLSGTSAGTLGYMAPEQLDGGEVDGRADLYSLGVVLYELLVGGKPMGNFRRPSQVRADVPHWLDEAVVKMLEPKPEDRIDSASAFLKEFTEESRPEPKSKKKWMVAALIAFLAVWLLWPDQEPRDFENSKPGEELLAAGNAAILRGRWEKREGGYQSASAIDLLGVSREPLADAATSIRLSFVRLHGSRAVAVFFRHARGWTSVELGAWDEDLGGVGKVNGLMLREQADAFRFPVENGQRYDLDITISESKITTRVNGQFLQEVSIENAEVGIPDPWKWTADEVGNYTIVVGSFQSPTWFQSLEVSRSD